MNLKELRKYKGLTQKQLAEMANISLTSYQGYERGETSPSMRKIERIAHALDVDVNELSSLMHPQISNMGIPTMGPEAKERKTTIPKKVDRHNDKLFLSIFEYYLKLNYTGRDTLLERAEEMTQLEKYTRPETKDGKTLPIPVEI